jgi:hypothetical protein
MDYIILRLHELYIYYFSKIVQTVQGFTTECVEYAHAKGPECQLLRDLPKCVRIL